MTEAQINNLPDPDLFRDAVDLAQHGTFSARDLDEMDALLLALTRKFWHVKRG